MFGNLGNDRRHLAALTGLVWISDGKLFDHWSHRSTGRISASIAGAEVARPKY